MAHKPEGYNTASPYLLVKSAPETIAFIEAVFGGVVLRSFDAPGGGIMHAEVRIDDTVVMMGEVQESAAASVHVYVPDADVAFARAVAAGGTVVQEVMSKGDGDRRGGVADANGITWWMATQEG